MPYFAKYLHGRQMILDPMAGSGRIFDLERSLPGATIKAIEIEPEWADMHPKTQLGNALHLPFPPETFDAICVSPAYGNRMADNHKARDASKRNTYTHTLGRTLHPDNAGQLHWGAKYREFHVKAWTEARRVLKDDGIFVLNTKNFLKTKKITKRALPDFETIRFVDEERGKMLVEVDITGWHVKALERLGFVEMTRVSVNTRGNRQGANGGVRVSADDIVVLKVGA